MAKTIGTILSLTDKVSPKLITIGRNFDSLDKKQQAMAKSAAYQLNNYANSLGSAATAAAKFAGASALALGGAAVKTGLSEAMGLETYRTQLLTATKDTQRAAEAMRYAIGLANQTPFEGADMVSAAATLEMAGMKTEKYLTLLGDVAAATNRQISDIQGGFTRAFQLGDYSALREATGMLLNAETIAEYARARGITDQTEALYTMLTEKFGGSMAALAQTTKGAWSTITGATKNALANIVGATNDGSVRAGSALDILKQKATGFADTLVRWQEDGTIEAWSVKFADGFGKAWESAEGLWKLLSNNKEIVIGVSGSIIAVNSLAKSITSLGTVLKTTKTLLGAFKSGALGLSTTGALGIGAAAVGATVAILDKAGKGTHIITDDGVEYADDHYKLAEEYKEKMKESTDAYSWLENAGKALWQWNLGASIGVESWKQNELYPFLTNTWNKTIGRDPLATNENAKKRNPALPVRERPAANALGTHFFRGGRSLVGEYGPELVELPVGARIYPHNETRQILQQTTNETQQFTSHSRTTNNSTQTINRGRNTITMHFTINGAGDPDQVADMVCEKIMEALDNV